MNRHYEEMNHYHQVDKRAEFCLSGMLKQKWLCILLFLLLAIFIWEFTLLMGRIHEIQKNQMSQSEFATIVRDEFIEMYYNQRELCEKQAQNMLVHDSQLLKLEEQMKTVVTQLEVLTEALKDAKEKIIHLKGVCLSEEGVRKIVRNNLLLYDADKTGFANFALESGGGSIISSSETYTKATDLTIFGIPLWYEQSCPRFAIQPSVLPGQCWVFKGSEGYIVIQLSGWVQPTAFSLEHMPRSPADNNLSNAPKEFSVYGLKSEDDAYALLLGKYVYDIEGEPLQCFIVAAQFVEAFSIIRLHIHTNYGNPLYTCLYHFSVHGIVVKN